MATNLNNSTHKKKSEFEVLTNRLERSINKIFTTAKNSQNKALIKGAIDLLSDYKELSKYLDFVQSDREEQGEEINYYQLKIHRLKRIAELFTAYSFTDLKDEEIDFLEYTSKGGFHTVSSAREDLFLLLDIKFHRILGARFKKKATRNELHDKVKALNENLLTTHSGNSSHNQL